MAPLPDIIGSWIIHSRNLFYSRAKRALAAARGLQEQSYGVYLPVGKGVNAAVKAPESRENGYHRFGAPGIAAGRACASKLGYLPAPCGAAQVCGFVVRDLPHASPRLLDQR